MTYQGCVVTHLSVDQNAPSSHNISVPNWFTMHLFCSRCKNKPCVHRVELLSNLKKKCAKLCLIQCTLLRKQYPPLYIIFKVHDFKNNTAVHTKHCEADGASAPKPSFHHKVMFFLLFILTLIGKAGKCSKLTRRFNHAVLSLYRPSTLEHSVTYSICPDRSRCYLFVRFPAVLPRTPLNKPGLS